MDIQNLNRLKETLTIRKMEMIVTLAELKSLTQTAEAFGRTVPSVSLTITRLEDLSGIKIFSKRGQSFVLSEDGVALVTLLKEMLRVFYEVAPKASSDV
ncbi:LysR family transcriptional regulator [Erythrobacter sp. SCSIO 43205]|uniref:LysR family transcriptional regulator n=1 Tax=Erythrobacter sp. SCSIO 43205 TaxID=2779361 RepID=UPI001CA8EC90|nr:LysR family transcriptional regulator [Erythrobacter sp. SCSIO 43205]UAB78957.1 LysR family transcriptional regulator [Erythrobacter sp. SCSIO 43205]